VTLWSPHGEFHRTGAERRAPSILVVDDDQDTRELYRACFDLSGFPTAEAPTGHAALAAAQRVRPDVLITDMILPDIDGFEVARRMRRDLPMIRVIMLTGYGIEDFQYRASSAGIARALLKPILPDVMLREVRHALRQDPAA
jgi:CheY-like chemotaxis protein